MLTSLTLLGATVGALLAGPRADLAALGGPSAPPGAPSSSSAATVVALRAARVHVGDGTVLQNATVVVQDGKVLAVGETVQLPEGAVLIEVEGELSPGLVALRDFSTARGEHVDSTRNVMPTVDLALAFDPKHRDARALVEQGITSIVLAAPGTQLVGGLAAVVDPGTGVVVKRGAMLCVGAGTRALSFNRYPTSTAAQYAELDGLFGADSTAGAEGQVAQVIADTKQRKLPLLLDVTDRADVLRAAAFAKRNGLTGALVGASRWSDVVAAAKDAGLAIIVGPLQVGGLAEAAAEAVHAAGAGVRIGFAADSPESHPALLRASAAQCVRAGLAPGAALRALTHDAATIAGVADRTGRIAPGLEADLVLWSGAPTDLTSRALKVWCDGQLVHDAAAQGGQQ
jgi:hypothetical protein